MTTLERHPFALLTALWLGLPLALSAQTATLTPTFSPTLQMTPPCAAGAVTFGKTTLGTSGDAQYNSSIRASKYSLSIPATVYTVSLYNTVVVAGTQVQVGIYQDIAGAIGPLLTNSLPLSVVNGWNVIPVPPVPLGAGDYWLAYLYDSPGAFKITYDQTAGVDSAALTASPVTLGNFPSLFPAPQYPSNWHEAIHASVCGPDTPTPTQTNTRTPTRTPTDTRTQTSTRTPTSTGTVLTPTRTSTSTPTPTVTSTRTHTPDSSLTPVCGAGAGQFGKSNIGDCLGYQAGAAVALRASLYPLSESATIVSLSLYQHPGNEGASIRVGIYQYLGANIGNLIVESGEMEAGPGWNHFLIPDTPLPAGNYWLAYLYSASSPYTVLAAPTPSGYRTLGFSTSVLWGNLPPIVPGAAYGDDWHEPILANYCPGPVDTVTPSPTRTETFTETPSPSLSPTPTPTDPNTPTQTPTGTLPTSTPTETGTSTSTETQTFTPTLSFTATNSLTPSPTRTITPTPVLTPPCGAIGTFGRTSLGSFTSGFTGSAAGVRGSVYPLSQGATVYSLSTYQLNGGFPLAAAIYSDQLGSVKDFIVGSAPQTLVGGWNLLPIPTTYLPPGNYWLVFHYNMGVGGSYEAIFGNSPAGSNTAFTYSGPVVVGAFPGQFGGITYENNDREIIYASFCPLATSTPTSTPTLGETPTATPSGSPSATSTLTTTPSPSSTGTPSSTATASGTSTPTLAVTWTATSTGTPTATGQPTSTSSGTSTSTPTGTSTPLDSPTSTASPTASETSTLSPTGTSTASASSTPTDTPAATSTLTSSHTATSTSTSTRTSTATPTQTPTLSVSNTPTSTVPPTSTASPTVTPVPFTPTPTASSTRTPSATVTATATVQAGDQPVIFQNPVRSGTLLLLPPAFPGLSEIKVEIFTTAFRRVAVKRYPAMTQGEWLVVELLDDQGRPLANGVYYLRVTTRKGRTLTTLVLAR